MTATGHFLLGDHPPMCGSCGARLTGRWESLSQGLCQSLIKFYLAVAGKGRNEIHLLKECGFTTNEINNFQKLKYFGLVAKIEDRTGYWLLTRRGEEFVRNQIAVPKRVFVFRNRIEHRSKEITSIRMAMKCDPYWLKREDFITRSDVTEYRQENLF